MLANGDIFHGNHHPVSVVQGRKSRNLLDPSLKVNAFPNGSPLKMQSLSDGFSYVIECKPNTEYTFTRNVLGTNPRGFFAVSSEYPSVGAYVSKLWADQDKTTLTFTTLADSRYIVLFLNRYATDTVGDIQVVEGSTALPYEPYGTVTDTIFKPTNLKKSGTELTFEKSYNHQAEVEVAGKSEQVQYAGKNLVKAVTLSESTVANIVRSYKYCVLKADGVASSISIITGTTTTMCVLEPGTYTASFEIVSGSCSKGSNSTNPCWQFFSTSGTLIASQLNLTSAGSRTLTITETTTVALRFIAYAGNVFDNFVIRIQVELGSTATPYEPYCGAIPSPNPDYPQPIESIDSVELVSRGKNPLGNEVGVYYNVRGVITQGKTFTIFCRDGELMNQARIEFYDDDFNYLDYWDSSFIDKQVLTVTWNKGIKAPSYARWIRKQRVDVMLVYGSTIPEFEPYISATRTIDLQGNQLRSLPDGTHDELRIYRDGSVELVKRVLAYVVTPSMVVWSGSAYSLYSGAVRIPVDAYMPQNTNELRTKFLSSAFVFNNMNYAGGVRQEPASRNIHHLFDPAKYSSLAQCKKYFEDNTVEEFLPLAEPQTIALPSIEPLPTYWPTTVIYDSEGNDISAYVKVVE